MSHHAAIDEWIAPEALAPACLAIVTGEWPASPGGTPGALQESRLAPHVQQAAATLLRLEKASRLPEETAQEPGPAGRPTSPTQLGDGGGDGDVPLAERRRRRSVAAARRAPSDAGKMHQKALDKLYPNGRPVLCACKRAMLARPPGPGGLAGVGAPTSTPRDKPVLRSDTRRSTPPPSDAKPARAPRALTSATPRAASTPAPVAGGGEATGRPAKRACRGRSPEQPLTNVKAARKSSFARPHRSP